MQMTSLLQVGQTRPPRNKTNRRQTRISRDANNSVIDAKCVHDLIEQKLGRLVCFCFFFWFVCFFVCFFFFLGESCDYFRRSTSFLPRRCQDQKRRRACLNVFFCLFGRKLKKKGFSCFIGEKMAVFPLHFFIVNKTKPRSEKENRNERLSISDGFKAVRRPKSDWLPPPTNQRPRNCPPWWCAAYWISINFLPGHTVGYPVFFCSHSQPTLIENFSHWSSSVTNQGPRLINRCSAGEKRSPLVRNEETDFPWRYWLFFVLLFFGGGKILTESLWCASPASQHSPRWILSGRPASGWLEIDLRYRESDLPFDNLSP